MDIYILMIDDDHDDYMLFSEVVKRYPELQCHHANHAEEGIKMMEAHQPDIVLLDMNMPRMNGLDCLKQIKKSDGISFIPVVIFSTCITDGLSKEAMKCGAANCIKKPNDIADFDKVVTQLIDIVKSANY